MLTALIRRVTWLTDRPELTWRDMQHIAVLTSVHFNPDDPDWSETAVKRKYSYKCELSFVGITGGFIADQQTDTVGSMPDVS